MEQRFKNKGSLTGFIIFLILSFILGSHAFAQEADSRLEKIKTQIHILNLLNGLELDREQMQLILVAAKEAEEICLKTSEAIMQKGEIIQTYQEVLRVARAGLIVVPQDVVFRFHKVHQEVEKIKKVEQEKLVTLTNKIKNSLRPHQIYALDDYKPCIIPPVKKGKIGQASDNSGFVKVLEHIRAMPKEQYYSIRDRTAQEAIDKLKVRVPRGYILAEGQLKAQLLKTMDEVRVMSDVDFAIQKEKIAENIKTQLLPEKPSVNIGVKIERFLLQPEIISILEERLKIG